MDILIVEDDVVFCKLLTKYLTKENYFTQDAQDVFTAKQLIENQKYKFVIIDYRLPGANGLMFSQWLIDRDEEVKIILMSRILDEELMSEGKKLGIIDFIKKPLNPKDLLGIIKQNAKV